MKNYFHTFGLLDPHFGNRRSGGNLILKKISGLQFHRPKDVCAAVVVSIRRGDFLWQNIFVE